MNTEIENKYSNIKGWKPLVLDTLAKLSKITDQKPYYIYQKYDELRFDIRLTGNKELDEQIESILDDAEEKSLTICVYCGLDKAEGTVCPCQKKGT